MNTNELIEHIADKRMFSYDQYVEAEQALRSLQAELEALRKENENLYDHGRHFVAQIGELQAQLSAIRAAVEEYRQFRSTANPRDEDYINKDNELFKAILNAVQVQPEQNLTHSSTCDLLKPFVVGEVAVLRNCDCKSQLEQGE